MPYKLNRNIEWVVDDITGAVVGQQLSPGNVVAGGTSILAQSGIPIIIPQSGTVTNGVYMAGQQLAAGVQFSAATGTNRVATFSAAVLLGTSADNGRIISILDGAGNYVTAQITAFSTTLAATVTITGTLTKVAIDYAQGTWQITGGGSVAQVAPVHTGGCWMYFPAGASLPSGAGLYWCVQVSAPVAQIYTAYSDLTAFVPYIPANPTAITTGGAAFTQATTALKLLSINVPGGLMGPTGTLRGVFDTGAVGSSATKTLLVNHGGGNIFSITWSVGPTIRPSVVFKNRGNNSKNYSFYTAGTGARFESAIDTSIDQSLAVSFTNAGSANDWLIFDGYTIEILPGT